MIDVCMFTTSLKLANITPVYKKDSKNSKESYKAGKYLAKYLKNL